MLVFVIVGAAGIGLLLLSMLFGEVFDLLDGAIVVANGLPHWVAYPVAAGLGLVALLVVQLVVQRFRHSEDREPEDPTELFGVARTRITASGGEVSLYGPYGPYGPYEVEPCMAFADGRIPAGTRIRVTTVQGARVKVEPA